MPIWKQLIIRQPERRDGMLFLALLIQASDMKIWWSFVSLHLSSSSSIAPKTLRSLAGSRISKDGVCSIVMLLKSSLGPVFLAD